MRAPFKKLRVINWGCAGPALIYLGVAIGLVAGAITLERRAAQIHATPTARAAAMPDDALTAELEHCQPLGRKAEDNQACAAAWAKNRKRFFGGQPQPGKASKP